MNLPQLYPLLFKPQLQPKIWGGERLAADYGKRSSGKIGESWEVSGVEGHVSLVTNGALEGRPLNHLIASYGPELLGKTVFDTFGKTFPLLIKFIDAKEDLSVQLHPDDKIAKERHNSFGKTEMWYILDAEENARLILGFNVPMDKEQYQEHLAAGTLTEALREVPVVPGDAFYIKPGTVHAIGAGTVLAEIQQTSDITYRIYDWDRPDVDGTMRALHTELALDVIDFSSSSEAELAYTAIADGAAGICTSPYFETKLLQLSKPMTRSVRDIDSFVIYMCTEGAVVVTAMGHSEKIKKGTTLLVPACAETVELDTEGATLLEVYVPSTP
ncbi:MAG: type I phosphomannose isomerase catalytic subunit [Bacteroidota bacterium]